MPLQERRSTDPDELDDESDLDDEDLQKEIAESYKAYLRGDVTEAKEFAKELRKELRSFKKR